MFVEISLRAEATSLFDYPAEMSGHSPVPPNSLEQKCSKPQRQISTSASCCLITQPMHDIVKASSAQKTLFGSRTAPAQNATTPRRPQTATAAASSQDGQPKRPATRGGNGPPASSIVAWAGGAPPCIPPASVDHLWSGKQWKAAWPSCQPETMHCANRRPPTPTTDDDRNDRRKPQRNKRQKDQTDDKTDDKQTGRQGKQARSASKQQPGHQ